MKPMISTKNMIHSFSSFLHRSIAVRPTALCAATCVYSPILSRTLIVACLLLLPLAGHAVAWYGETIKTTDNFYLYHCTTPGFLNSNGSVSSSPEGVCTWKFSSTSNGTIKSSDNKYIYIKNGTSASVGWNVGINSSPANLDITNTGDNKYAFSLYYEWKGEWTGIVYDKARYYFAYSSGIKGIKDELTEQCKWWLIPEAQVKNHVEVSTNNINFGEKTIGNSVSQTFTVKGCNPSEIQIIKSGDYANTPHFTLSTTSIKNPGYNATEVTITYDNAHKGDYSCSLQVQVAGNTNSAYNETITVSASTILREPTFGWNLPEAINAGQMVNNIITFPDNYLSLTGLSVSFTETGSNDYLDITGDANSGWSITAKEGADGTAYLTLTTSEAGQFAAKTETKSIRITNKKIQTIDWQQDFTDLTTESNALTLNAVAMSAGVATGRTITYTITDYGVVNLSGNTLSIVGAGRAKITATVTEDETYLGASLTKEIFVRDPNAICSSETITESYGSGRNGKELNKSTGALIVDIKCATNVSITHDKQIFTQQAVDVEQYVNGQYEKIGTFLEAGTNSFGVSYAATSIRLSVSSNYSHYINEVSYTTAPPSATPNTDKVTINTTGGTKATQSISIDWVNTMLHPNITGTNAAQFSVTTGYFGDCLQYGTRQLTITYTPSAGAVQETATLQLLDNSNSVKNEIPLVGNVTKLNQQITAWDVPSTPFKTTDNIDLSTYPIAANSGLTNFTYSIVSGEGTVANIDANGKLTILTGGTLVVRATQAGDATYNPVSADRTITIEKVTPTCVTLPTAKTIIKGQPLSEATLTGAVIRDDKSTIVAGTLAWDYSTATPSSGTYEVIFTPTNTGWYNSLTLQVPVKVLELPTFTCSPTTIDFGSAVSVIEGGSSTLAFSNLNDQGQTLTWHYAFSGTNANRFAIDGVISNSGCTVRFNPQDATAHTATLTICATYTAEGLTVESARQAISLTGTGYIPDAGLNYSLSTCDFGNVYGVKQASQEVGVHFVAVSEISAASFSWKNGNSDNIFGFTYTAGGTYDGTLAITAGVGVNTPVTATTVYKDVLVVKATKTIGGEEITAELPVKITLHPRQANTLALNIVEDGQNGIKAKYDSNGSLAYYYIYIDEIDQLLLKNRNNTTTPISFSLSTRFDTIATLDQDALTLSAVAKARKDHTIKISQPQSEEYEAGSIAEFNFRVIKYTPVVTFREGVMEQRTDRTDGIWYYAWRNTEYTDFIRTTNHEVPLEIECQTNSHNDKYFKIDRKGDWSFNLVTFNTNADIRLRIKQKESATFEQLGSYIYSTSTTTSNLDYVISVIKDPRHVSVTPIKTLWDNTAAGLHGNTFTENIVHAEWVGDQWVSNAWTGTKWTAGGSNYGSTNAFVIHSGGSVVFHFTGVPLYNYFVYRYANNEANGGTYTIEESSDGTIWSVLGSYSTHGGRTLNMSGNSKYLRISYQQGSSDKEYVVVWGGGIYERLVARVDKNYVTLPQEEAGGEFTPAKVTIKTANWGAGGMHVVSNSNPAFSIDLPSVTGNGIDEYKELIATIRYNPEIADASGIAQIVIKNDTTITKAAKDSVVIVAQAIAAVTKTIVPQNAAGTGLRTGTVAGPSTNTTYAFHRGLRDIDLSHCFDASGNALFDRLYVFGITNATNGSKITTQYTNSDGSGTTPVGAPRINTPTTGTTRGENYDFNASTTCYVYTKGSDGKSYTYRSTESFDATQKRFDHGSSLNGKKLYFTGYCPFANMGTKPSEMGWMYFTGGNSDGVDIYLEDCEIMGRYKTASGCGNTKDYEYNEVEITIGENWLTTGCSSIFVFKSNQTASGIYTPKIHILGNNHLKGQAGSLISKVIGTLRGLPIKVDAGINATGTASAPISILADGNEGITNLIFDDIWANNDTTNGFLKLDATSQQVGIADLGSTKGTLTFNGGQYNVRNSAADGQYTCNIMACYRAYTKTVAGQNITLNGIGADQPAGCKVTINSGTFTMTKNMQQISSKDYNGGDYYIDQENFMDLRLPGASIVNGGTFNGINEVVRCTSTTSQGSRPVNAYNSLLCLYSYNPADAGSITYLPNGAISCYLPSEVEIEVNQSIVKTPYYSYLNQRLATDATTVTGNAENSINYYGGQSINLDENGNINLLLQSEIYDQNEELTGYICEELAQIVFEQWAACTPSATASSSGVNQSGGFTGKTTVQSDTIDGVVYKTNRLLYAEMDKNITDGFYKDGDISIQFNNEHGEIVNEKDYTIHKELVSMVAVEADRWMAFVAPFDIYEVRIIEAADEDTLALKYSNDKDGALAYQATENICFSYKLANYVVKDLAGGRTTSMSFNDLAGMCIRNMAYDAQQSKYNRGYYTLDHYDGSNIMTANYYLYEIDNAEDTCIFPTDRTGTALEIKWKPVATKASAARADSLVLMKKGHVYAIQFPYCPMCNDVDTRTTYDYWTGKLIVFHGKGPQKVSGTNRQDAIRSATAEAGKAVLTGNYTFANLNAPAGIYAHNTKNDLFERTSSATTIKPMQGYMLFSSPIANATALSISRAGRISYEYDSDITTDDHIPTIGSRASMLVYRTDNGFAVDPVRTQRVMLYNLNGQLLFNGTLTEGERHGFNLTQGIYLLKGEEEIIKVMVN